MRTPLALALHLLLAAGSASAQGPGTMHIEGCNLGCSSGAAGAQVSCSLVSIHVDQELRVRFSRPVDPASVHWTTFQLIDVNSGQIPIGVYFVDPLDPQEVVFRPSLAFDALGNPVFGFTANTTYRLTIPGSAQGDLPPFIVSTDPTPLENQSRMQCDAQTTLGVGVPTGSTSYCFGTTACPCGGSGAPGRGCANSASTQGVGLGALGISSVGADTLRFYLHGVPSGPAVYFQGTLRENGGAGTPFGEGLFCAGGTAVRLRSQTAGGGTLQVIPSGAHPPISVQGQVPGAGGTRTYQAWYREPVAQCTGANFNWTSAVEIVWVP